MNNTESVVDLALKAQAPVIVKSESGREFLICGSETTEKEITDPHGLKPAPKYIAQIVTLQSADALIEYTKRYKTEATLLFADIAANRITAAVDYHLTDKASNVTHKGALQLPFSEEWDTWNKINEKMMGQLEFARFLEENASEVVAPEAGELLDACRDLQVHRKVNFIKAVRTQSDNENFEFTDETQATSKRGDLELPTRVKLSMPVYFNDANRELFAFLRWRVDEGALTLGIKLHRLEHVRQAVFKSIVLDVADKTGCPVVFGIAP